MLYRIGATEFIWVTNASNGPKILAHLTTHAKDFDVEVFDKSRDITMIAVQGPRAWSLISKMAGRELDYERFTCNPIKLAGYDTYLCRTGYTGEDDASYERYTEENRKFIQHGYCVALLIARM